MANGRYGFPLLYGPRTFAERHIWDFTGWNDHDSYQKASDRLLRDLKAEAPGRASA